MSKYNYVFPRKKNPMINYSKYGVTTTPHPTAPPPPKKKEIRKKSIRVHNI